MGVVRISIHAPARGATLNFCYYSNFVGRFQSTHPHGVRPEVRALLLDHLHFNPRTRTGCDGRVEDVGTARRRISIHAPARGATPGAAYAGVGWLIFQSTHPHGVRHRGRTFGCLNCSFQSTHPHGVRPAEVRDLLLDHLHFNPRTRTGCDARGSGSWIRDIAFQSTHPHGVRHMLVHCTDAAPGISIHAPARGATVYPQVIARQSLDFNPRTRTGCDRPCRETARKYRNFNPRTRTGCDVIAG